MSALTAVGHPVALVAPLLTVDLSAMAANVRAIDSRITGSVMAVVKANGFGHGAVEVARVALANGATRLGVATIAEALALREAGLAAPVLSWLNPLDADFDAAVRRRVELAVSGLAHLRAVMSAAARVRVPARVHLHVDTGMSRDGSPLRDWEELTAAARVAEQLGLVDVVGVMGHLPCADQPGHPSTALGRDVFLFAVRVARRAGLRPRVRHLAATAAALGAPETQFDACRIGAGLYGIGAGLRPALTLRAPVVSVREARAGTPVGYGHTWIAAAETKLALIPLGYGDGLPRAASASAEVLVHGHRRRVAGLISMDQFVVDVGDLPVQAGDEVTVFGPGNSGEPTIAEWSDWSATLPHEIMTGLGSRIARAQVGRR